MPGASLQYTKFTKKLEENPLPDDIMRITYKWDILTYFRANSGTFQIYAEK